MKLAHRRLLATLGAAGLCATVLGAGGSAQAAAPFTDPSSGTTSTYEAVDGSYTWDQANAAASATAAPDGCTAHLAVITSQAEQDYITTSLGSQSSKFIGARRTEAHGEFAWVTGEPFSYTDWNAGEPNDFDNGDGTGESVVQFAIGPEDNSWNDISDQYTSGYILETQCDAPPTPGPLMVTGVDPSHGSASGGDTVTITGSGFTGATKVRFGARSATYTVDSDTQITAIVPRYTGELGPRGHVVNVRVYTSKKTKSPKVRVDRYTYDAPSTVS